MQQCQVSVETESRQSKAKQSKACQLYESRIESARGGVLGKQSSASGTLLYSRSTTFSRPWPVYPWATFTSPRGIACLVCALCVPIEQVLAAEHLRVSGPDRLHPLFSLLVFLASDSSHSDPTSSLLIPLFPSS